ncbi:hypothetical protein SteCoe_27383 [Stentor coeruleus]|uniref:Uncharacterized protein n=1 Tax=Stentor coeruleus TaxID=5963 RepID=A0A1R2BAK7_9CILI|nr:hypothetical protein SteCoe_27383 [Stentor coeruleus]
MLIWIILSLASAEQSHSFLQQEDTTEGVDIEQASQADYDLQEYETLGEETIAYSKENYEPEGESTPENDYLLEQYKKVVEYIYLNYYVIPMNATLTEEAVTVVEGDIITEEEAEESTGPTEETRGEQTLEITEGNDAVEEESV